MSIKTIETLVDLANKIDEEGAYKVADEVTELIEKYSQSMDFAAKAERSFSPDGDPFSYSFNEGDLSFKVLTAPAGKEFAVGRVIKPGDPGYDLLKQEATSMGIMGSKEEPMTKELPKAEVPASSDKVYRLMKELGMASVPASQQDLDVLIESKENLFRDRLKKLKALVNRSVSMFASGSVVSIINTALEEFDSDTITASRARYLWNTFKDLDSGINPERMKVLDRNFYEALDVWSDSLKLRRLGMELFSKKADDMDIAEAMFDGEKSMSKIASLKEDYKNIFSFENSRPFNRSR